MWIFKVTMEFANLYFKVQQVFKDISCKDLSSPSQEGRALIHSSAEGLESKA